MQEKTEASDQFSTLLVVYNDNLRLTRFLSHAKLWNKDITVLIKGSRDIEAELICENHEIQPVYIPYSKQGAGDMEKLYKIPSKKWIWHFTTGEIPTRRLVSQVEKQLISRPNISAVRYPVKIYSFGEYVERPWGGPWSLSYQNRLVNRDQTVFIDKVHVHYQFRDEVCQVPFDGDNFVFHPTHAGFESFIKSHVDYALCEADQAKNKLSRAYECIGKAYVHDLGFAIDGQKGMVQALAWKTYWLMAALACLTYDKQAFIDETYQRLTTEILQKEWGG